MYREKIINNEKCLFKFFFSEDKFIIAFIEEEIPEVQNESVNGFCEFKLKYNLSDGKINGLKLSWGFSPEISGFLGLEETPFALPIGNKHLNEYIDFFDLDTTKIEKILIEISETKGIKKLFKGTEGIYFEKN